MSKYNSPSIDSRTERKRREWKAWQECGHADCKDGYFPCAEVCFVCDGEGGWWHPNISTPDKYKPHHRYLIVNDIRMHLVTRSSIIVQEGVICVDCAGTGYNYQNVKHPPMIPCEPCNGTGISPSSESWSVEEAV